MAVVEAVAVAVAVAVAGLEPKALEWGGECSTSVPLPVAT